LRHRVQVVRDLLLSLLGLSGDNLLALGLKSLIDLFVKAFSRLREFILLLTELVGFAGELGFPRD
jgi:hypothetical protein